MTTPFNFNSKPPVNKWLLALLAILLLWLVAVLLPGCEIIKHTKKSNTDSASVRRNESGTIDSTQSGSLSKSNTLSKEDFDWWKTTMHFGERKDTNVYNFHNYPASSQPATIIYEGGKGSKETETNSFDSNWIKNALTQFKNEYDSSHLKSEVKEKDKETETKGFGLLTLIIIVVCTNAGQALIMALYKKSPYKIVRVSNQSQ